MEDCLVLSMTTLVRKKAFVPGALTRGTWGWWREGEASPFTSLGYDPRPNLSWPRLCSHAYGAMTLLGPHAGSQPTGAGFAQLAPGRLLIPPAVRLTERIAPAAVRPLVDKGLRAAFPEGTAERNGLGRVRLHVREAAVLEDGRPPPLVNRNVEERRDAPDLAQRGIPARSATVVNAVLLRLAGQRLPCEP